MSTHIALAKSFGFAAIALVIAVLMIGKSVDPTLAGTDKPLPPGSAPATTFSVGVPLPGGPSVSTAHSLLSAVGPQLECKGKGEGCGDEGRGVCCQPYRCRTNIAAGHATCD